MLARSLFVVLALLPAVPVVAAPANDARSELALPATEVPTEPAPADAANAALDDDDGELPTPQSEFPSDEPTAGDVHGLPPPDDASGESRHADEDNALLWVPRVLLFPVRLVYEVPGQGLKGTAWLIERYRVRDVYQQIFFNEDGTFGIFPTAFFETGFGLNVGVRLIHRDLLGHHESVSFRAGYGGQFRQTLIGQFRSGELFGSRFRLELLGGNDARPAARFFGIGNAGTITAPPASIPVDPIDENFALRGRYSEKRTRAEADMRYLATKYFSVAASIGWLIQSFGNCTSCNRGDDLDEIIEEQDVSENVNVREVYDTSKLVGFSEGLSNMTYALSLSYDSREPANDFIPKPTPSSGWRVGAFGGRTEGFSNDPSHFWRAGADIARVFNVFRGDRTLTLRVYFESVFGDLTGVPFTSLPQLGGNFVLRAEQIGRYRDKNVGSFQTEYLWSLNRNLSSFVFFDVGRVWRDYKDFEFAHFHPGGGFGIQAHTQKTFLMRVMVGYNGDMARFAFSIDPLYDQAPRAEW